MVLCGYRYQIGGCVGKIVKRDMITETSVVGCIGKVVFPIFFLNILGGFCRSC